MRRRWVLIGAALLGAGLYGVSSEDSPHHACTAGLGDFGSLSGEAARNCGLHNLAFLLGIAGAILGFAVMLAALLIRS